MHCCSSLFVRWLMQLPGGQYSHELPGNWETLRCHIISPRFMPVQWFAFILVKKLISVGFFVSSIHDSHIFIWSGEGQKPLSCSISSWIYNCIAFPLMHLYVFTHICVCQLSPSCCWWWTIFSKVVSYFSPDDSEHTSNFTCVCFSSFVCTDKFLGQVGCVNHQVGQLLHRNGLYLPTKTSSRSVSGTNLFKLLLTDWR